MALPDDITDNRGSNKKSIEELLQEVRIKQQSNHKANLQPAAQSRSKWNVKKKDGDDSGEKETNLIAPKANLLLEGTTSSNADQVKFPVKEFDSEYTIPS
jgi:hypothetical protein